MWQIRLDPSIDADPFVQRGVTFKGDVEFSPNEASPAVGAEEIFTKREELKKTQKIS